MTQQERQEKLSYIVRELFKQYQEYVSKKLDVSKFTVGDTPEDMRAHWYAQKLYAVGEVMRTFYINEYESDFLNGFTDEQLEFLCYYIDLHINERVPVLVIEHLAKKCVKKKLRINNYYDYCDYKWIYEPYDFDYDNTII